MSRLVTIKCQGETNVHLPDALGSYATLCGLDGDDPGCELETSDTPRGAKVDCDQCASIWQLCKTFRASVFLEPVSE